MAKRNGIVWRNRDLNDLKTNITRSMEGQEKQVADILEGIGAQAEEKMRQIIRTTESGIVAGKPDRIKSGTMIDAVGYNPVKRDGRKLSVEFGWTEEQLKYFLWQEDGTGDGVSRNWNNIVPMHALLQTFIEAREQLLTELNRNFR